MDGGRDDRPGDRSPQQKLRASVESLYMVQCGRIGSRRGQVKTAITRYLDKHGTSVATLEVIAVACRATCALDDNVTLEAAALVWKFLAGPVGAGPVPSTWQRARIPRYL